MAKFTYEFVEFNHPLLLIINLNSRLQTSKMESMLDSISDSTGRNLIRHPILVVDSSKSWTGVWRPCAGDIEFYELGAKDRKEAIIKYFAQIQNHD